jgi:uncharacterized protein YndB with AHSA1/START domain
MTGEKPNAGARAPEPRRQITLERIYRADGQDVWDLWTTKEGIESWASSRPPRERSPRGTWALSSGPSGTR